MKKLFAAVVAGTWCVVAWGQDTVPQEEVVREEHFIRAVSYTTPIIGYGERRDIIATVVPKAAGPEFTTENVQAEWLSPGNDVALQPDSVVDDLAGSITFTWSNQYVHSVDPAPGDIYRRTGYIRLCYACEDATPDDAWQYYPVEIVTRRPQTATR